VNETAFFNRHRVGVALAGIALIAAALRFWGLSYGLPHPLARPDEEIVVGHALELSLGRIANRQTFPHPDLLYFRDPVRGRSIPPNVGFAYPYPDLVYEMDALLLGAWRKAEEWTGRVASKEEFVDRLALRHPSAAYLICRSVGAICGTGTVLATVAAAWWAYRRRSVALLAGLLVAVNYLHARESHYATVDVPMTFAMTLALGFALKAAASEQRRDVLWSAAFAGLAASAKFNGAIVVLSTVVAAARRLFDPGSARGRVRIVWTLALAAAVMTGAFAVTSPWCLRYYQTVHLGLREQRRVLFSTPGPPAGLTFLTATLPGAFGWPAFAIVLLGIGRALLNRRAADLILLALIVPAFASMAGITWVLPRYPLPLIPALATIAADTGLTLIPARLRAWAGTALILLLIGPPLTRILPYDRLAARPDTRLQAADWLAAHAPPLARIAVCRGYGAPIVNIDPRAPPAFDRVDLLPCTGDAMQTAGAEFVVIHTHPAVPFFAPSADAHPWLDLHAHLLATFTPFRRTDAATGCFYPGDAFYLPYCGFDSVDRGGPIITIWAVER
jgi:hypothetical protein